MVRAWLYKLYTTWPELTIAEALRNSWQHGTAKTILSLNLVETQMARATPLEGCRSNFPQRDLHIQAVPGRPSQRERLEGEAVM